MTRSRIACALAVLLAAALPAASPSRAAEADDLQPGVQTSSAAAPVTPAAAARPAAPAKPSGAPGRPVGKPPAAAGSPAPGVTRSPGAHDRVELDTTQITGNKELPNVMYVVPWKKPELGDFGGRPPKSLLDELLAPVDRDVFRRQNRYYAALKAGPPAGQGASAPTGAGASPAGDGAPAPAPQKSTDEK